MLNFTGMALDELKKLGFMRWGRDPMPNLWLIRGETFRKAQPGQTLYGIDGKPYVIGVDHIDTTLLFGYLAYGVKVDSDTKPGLPEIDPATLQAAVTSSKGRRKAERDAARDRGTFLN